MKILTIVLSIVWLGAGNGFGQVIDPNAVAGDPNYVTRYDALADKNPVATFWLTDHIYGDLHRDNRVDGVDYALFATRSQQDQAHWRWNNYQREREAYSTIMEQLAATSSCGWSGSGKSSIRRA